MKIPDKFILLSALKLGGIMVVAEIYPYTDSLGKD